MKEIPLPHGLVALVDDEDYTELSQYEWRVDGSGYVIRMVPHPEVRGKQVWVAMHRTLLGLQHGDPREGDHRDNNKLNNRRCNLRICSTMQNLQNRGLLSSNTSGFKGVSWRQRDRSWRATIRANNRSIYLGQFKTAEEAYEAYCKAAIELHGEFANLG